MREKTIVFIHGMFVTASCWKPWQDYFQARGYRTSAPPWPEHELPADEERAKHPNAALARLELADLLEHYRKAIRALEEKPILIGHSMGGLIVQLLLQEDLAAAGVAIDSAPPKGVITTVWSFLKSNWPAINPFASANKPIYMDEAAFHYAFTNTLDDAQSRAAWTAAVVPESRRVGKGPTTDSAKLDFQRPHPPLLLIAGEKDHIIPAQLIEKLHAQYRKGPSQTDLKTFPGRDHWLIAAAGWQELADYAREWIEKSETGRTAGG